MKEAQIEYIKNRLKDIEKEKTKLLNELAVLQDQTQKKTLSASDTLSIKPKPIGDEEKISLFLELFTGRTDVFAKLWENKKSGKKGWSPVCSNEWVKGICEKPKIKCAECSNQSFEPFNAKVIHCHLKGEINIGAYAIGKDNNCRFLAVDFDKENWQDDMILFKNEGAKLGIDVALERSRSGNGGHAWIFFSESIPAILARKLGSIIINQAMRQSSQLTLSSYDRFFPNQDFIPKGGFGNLIALPLQGTAKEKGNSVFIDKNMQPFVDQWKYLFSVRRISHNEVSQLVDRFSIPSETSHSTIEDEQQLWLENSLNILSKNKKNQFVGVKVESELFSQIKINIKNLPAQLVFSLRRLTVFANPEFFRKQRMRFSTWNIPKYVFCGEQIEDSLILPGGLVDSCKEICESTGAKFYIKDKRPHYKKLRLSFKGKLRKEQKQAMDVLLQHEKGVLTAPPGSGKTVIGCALISKRKLPTLILVHRAPLGDQWKKKINEFIKFDSEKIGIVSGQKKKWSGKIDIAMMQTINKMKNLNEFLSCYGQIIIDECHHVPAFTFESIIKKAPAIYITGLTATPYRKDGLQSIIHIQCGPIRYQMKERELNFRSKRVIFRNFHLKMPVETETQPPIHKVWDFLVYNEQRIELITKDLKESLEEGRFPLLISDRKEHLQLLKKALFNKNIRSKKSHIFILDGCLSKNQRHKMLDNINHLLSQKESVCLLATGALIGEGFDLPALDTLFLTMPVAFSGRLIQYTGRLHRPLEGKKEIRVYDYVDTGSGLTMSMFKKRVKIYRQIGYRMESDPAIYKHPFQNSLFS